MRLQPTPSSVACPDRATPLDDLKVRGYDLSARNLHQNDRKHLPHPAEIMARLLE
jgi:hypothetical protein